MRYSILSIFVLLAIPSIALSQTQGIDTTNAPTSKWVPNSYGVQTQGIKSWTVPFGGRVISTKIPLVDCSKTASTGTAPVVLSSNLAGLGQATIGATGEQSTVNRVANISAGAYKAIPLFTYRYAPTGKKIKQPKSGDWILGYQSLVPSLNECDLRVGQIEIPFPVVKTNNYAVSE